MNKKVVLITGAGGQTGQSLFRQCLEEPDYQAIGIVRSEASKQALIDAGGIPDPSCIKVADVTDRQALQKVVDQYSDNLAAFCICTSAKPAPTGEMNEETGRPVFGFPNGDPELVDWQGQKNQIDVCPDGTHVVVCSTMGGTNPDHPLNNLGRTRNEDGSFSGGNIVKWKRQAEVYLMDQKRLAYTIVHPGGLVNEPRGERRLVAGVDDDVTTGTDSRTVPREDVARVMLEAVKNRDVYAGRSFDLRAALKEEGAEKVDTDFASLLDSLEGKNCDYSLGEIMLQEF